MCWYINSLYQEVFVMRRFGYVCLILIAVVAITLIVISHLASNRSKDEKAQQDIDSVAKVLDKALEATPSMDILETTKDTMNVTFSENEKIDLEKTIRLFHILDDGYKNSQNLQEYLHFVASQDYRNIPSDVIKAKKKILPYYKSLRRAEEDLDAAERRNLWKAVTENENLTSVNSPLAEGIRVVASGGLDAVAVSNFVFKGVLAGKNLYEDLKKNDKIEKEARAALDKHQDAYLAYLEDFMRVYVKYMAQWNRLCLMRDQAYIAINNNDIETALSALSQVLSEFPSDRESILLKAFCLVRMAQTDNPSPEKFGGLADAKKLLDVYIKEYPEKSAPAFVLLGTCAMLQGDDSKAKILFDQSSVEYPRQAKELLDMYNSYNYRNYLTKSVEGHFVQTLYKSMMEGLGFFSPNFQKALIAYEKNDLSRAKEEIFRHFFRRGNQDVFDYLITDMKYVEKYMPSLLNMIFEEHSFLDLQTYNPTLSFSDKLAVKVENRSDRRLSNVRLFLCLHLTDMYKDEYQVKKMEATVNNIEPHSVADFGKLQLDYEIYGKKKNNVSDIVSARAIIMTDSLIIWVDEDKVKRTNILNKIKKKKDLNSFEKMNFSYMGKKWNVKSFANLVHSQSSVEIKDKNGLLGTVMGSKKIVFHFPRVLDGLNPFFSFGPLNNKDAILPASVILNGDHIDVEFEKQSSFANSVKPLFISSAEGVFYMDVTFDEKGDVIKISEMKF